MKKKKRTSKFDLSTSPDGRIWNFSMSSLNSEKISRLEFLNGMIDYIGEQEDVSIEMLMDDVSFGDDTVFH